MATALVIAAALSALAAPARARFHFVYQKMSWSQAQSYCRRQYLDLVTVETAQDLQVLNRMMDFSKATPDRAAWIGLYDDKSSWTWSLSDPNFYREKEDAFRRWQSGEPSGAGECGQMQSSGDWREAPCSYLSTAVCVRYTAPVFQMKMKIKVAGGSSVDWSDPEVQGILLEKLRQKAVERGAKGDVRLSWKKQRDGKIFQKDEF